MVALVCPSGGGKSTIVNLVALFYDPDSGTATSSLDAESKHLVQEDIDRAMKGRTVIAIAHRLSTVRNAFKVIVMDKGEIADQETHEELLAKNGIYK